MISPITPAGWTSKRGAVFVDLDRTLLRGASGPVIDNALRAEGLLDGRPKLPASRFMYGFYDLFGETLPMMALVRSAAHFVKGWPEADFRRAGERAAPILAGMVQPFARGVLEEHKESGHLLVICTTTPADLVIPLAESLGFDDVVATRYARSGGTLSGGIDGDFVWGFGKLAAARRYAQNSSVDFSESHAYSDSVYDAPLLRAVGHPHALKPDPRLRALARAARWPIEHWDRPTGVPKIAGVEPYHLLRVVVRPEAFPYAAVRHCWNREDPAIRSGAGSSQPPQLFRRGCPCTCSRTGGQTRAFPGEARAIRRPRDRAVGPGARGHTGRPRERVGPAASRGDQSAQSRRGRGDPSARHDPPRSHVLRA